MKYLVLIRTDNKAGIQSNKHREVIPLYSWCKRYCNAYPVISGIALQYVSPDRMYSGMLRILNNSNLQRVIRSSYDGFIVVGEFSELGNRVIKALSTVLERKSFDEIYRGENESINI